MLSDIESLSNAVVRLQSENRRLKQIGMAVLVLIAAALLMGQTRSPRVVEAKAFLLKGPDGSIRAKMGTQNGSTELVFYSPTSQPRVVIKSDEDGEVLEMKNDAGEMHSTVGVALQKPGKISPTTSTIGVLGSRTGPGVFMHATKEIGQIRVDDETGMQIWTASSKPAATKGSRE